MREIKFRALAVVNDKHNNIKVGDFVYGQYIESGCDAPCIIFGDGEQIEVDKNTLGQLVCKYKNGIVEYEGDIVKVTDTEQEESTVGKIAWFDCYYPAFDVYVPSDRSATGFESYSDEFNTFTIGYIELEVIGNIHQNPELLTA